MKGFQAHFFDRGCGWFRFHTVLGAWRRRQRDFDPMRHFVHRVDDKLMPRNGVDDLDQPNVWIAAWIEHRALATCPAKRIAIQPFPSRMTRPAIVGIPYHPSVTCSIANGAPEIPGLAEANGPPKLAR